MTDLAECIERAKSQWSKFALNDEAIRRMLGEGRKWMETVILISELRALIAEMLSYLEELGHDSVTIGWDEYWDIQEPSLRYSGQHPGPDALSDKSLSKDWKTIQSIQDNPKKHLKNLVEASNLLRAIGDYLPHLLGPDLWEERGGEGAFDLVRASTIRTPKGAYRAYSEDVYESASLEEPEPESAVAGARYSNVCLTEGEARSVVPQKMQLGTSRNYDLRLDIGPLSAVSVVTNTVVFPVDLLPRSDDGYWLEVIAASDEFSIEPGPYSLFLPNTGPSWVCNCAPGGEHSCDQHSRRDHLFIPIKVPDKSGTAHVRIAFYFSKNLIQSQLLTAEVADEPQLGSGYSSLIDYSLTASLRDVSFLPQRSVNIMTNADSASAHQLVINSGLNEAIIFNPTEGKVKSALEAARKALSDMHFKVFGGELGASLQYENLYDQNNSKPKKKFIEDLKSLAPLGYKLYDAMLYDKDQREELKEYLKQADAKIQVSRPKGSDLTFPWALMYEIPLVADQRQHKICRILDEWNGTPFSGEPNLCPYEAEHQINTICPFGFWGFRYVIEQPPSMPSDRKLPDKIPTGSGPMEIVVARSIKLDMELSKSHLESIRKNLPTFSLVDCQTSSECCSSLGEPDLELVYFYCHGRRDEQKQPYLEIGIEDKISPADIGAWDSSLWPKNHWRKTAPLVFINGCHTTELTPDLLVNFVDDFVGNYAAGVIGH